MPVDRVRGAQCTVRGRSVRMLKIAVPVLLSAVAAPLSGQVKQARADRGFHMFAQALGALTINRVYCGLTNTGEQCTDSLNTSTIGGGFWPKGTANQYYFNSGLQMAGIIGPDGGPWAGDTTGAFFFDPKGTTIHASPLTPIYNSNDPADRMAWPEEGRVAGDLFQPDKAGDIAVSEADLWWLMWEGDPTRNVGRPHPMGILVETRGMGWNHPGGNEDIVYFVHTFYNVTSLDPGDYLSAPVAMRPTLLQYAQQFHALNNTGFGITLPQGGYSLREFFVAYSSDPDVADAGVNYMSVNLPMALGFAWHPTFGPFRSWTFDPALHSAPFFAGSGFAGIKFLRGPSGSDRLQIYSNTEGSGVFGHPANTTQLYRYLSGNIDTQAGDAPCNTGDPLVTHICYVNTSRPFDMKHFQSATNAPLAPGEYRSLATAYVFAAPVATPACGSVGSPGCNIAPGDATNAGDPVKMLMGVPEVERIAGYVGFNDVDGDGVVNQYEYLTVPRSLQGKAQLAQAFFDNRFVAPSAPEPPEFFLVPGDDQVTVMWRPSPSEQTGDSFFDVATDANRPPPGGGPALPNPLYDPNYRQFDVEGYRIYRGRQDDPDAMELIATYDYRGTTFKDYGGQVNADRLCAPELGIRDNCPIVFDSIGPGIPRTAFVEYPISWPSIVQVRFGDRIALPDGSAQVLTADTVTAADWGVPFLYIDEDVRNAFRYFYAVTAFDVNSWQSGPSSLESVRILKQVTPERRASNLSETEVTVTSRLEGRGVALDTASALPTIDPVSGVFSGPMPPANGWSFQLSALADHVLLGRQSGNARLDSVGLGNAWGSPEPNIYWYTVSAGGSSSKVSLMAYQPFLDEPGRWPVGAASFPAVPVDPGLAERFGGSGNYLVPGTVNLFQPGIYLTNGTGRSSSLLFSDGAEHEALWDGSFYDGPRWFSGANESFANPTGGFCAPNCTVTNWNNAGSLPGVTTIHQPAGYTTMNFSFREFQGALGGASRAADMALYWGANGVVDSVIDLTHNVPVPFKDKADGTWGFLTIASQTGPGSFDGDPTTVSIADFVCVDPFLRDTRIRVPCGQQDDPYPLQSRAALGPVGFVTTDWRNITNYYARTGTGFGLYIAGNVFLFEMDQLPTPGSVWTLRDYAGGIHGGKGTDSAGTIIHNAGDYGFIPATRPMTVVGAEIHYEYDAVQRLNEVTSEDLDAVHPVPDPFYFRSGYEQPEVIRFVNLPQQAIIRIYSSSGVLIALVEHASSTLGGEAEWNVRNRDGNRVAPGVYFYHLESDEARRVGRMLVVSAQR